MKETPSHLMPHSLNLSTITCWLSAQLLIISQAVSSITKTSSPSTLQLPNLILLSGSQERPVVFQYKVKYFPVKYFHHLMNICDISAKHHGTKNKSQIFLLPSLLNNGFLIICLGMIPCMSNKRKTVWF